MKPEDRSSLIAYLTHTIARAHQEQVEVDALRTVLGDMSVRSVRMATDHGWEARDAASAALNKMFEAIKAASS